MRVATEIRSTFRFLFKSCLSTTGVLLVWLVPVMFSLMIKGDVAALEELEALDIFLELEELKGS